MITAMVAVTGCSTMTRKHGFVPLPEDLAQMTVGVTTRDEIVALVGPPTTAGAINGQTLYYVQSERSRFGPFEPEIKNREVAAISFTQGGVLSNIERFGMEQGRVVVLSRRITDDGIADVTFVGQLLGAIGRIDAGQLIDGPLGEDI
jgi:outer membrane protein assembly factor BamE (lipoprotein component of BamABCDE complex)